jgi:hypothetical protein
MNAMRWEHGPGRVAENLPSELEMVLCCGRALIDPAASNRIRTLIHDGVKWRDVVATAERHRLAPIVYEVIASLEPSAVSAVPMDQLRGAAAQPKARALGLLRELLRLYPLFEAVRIPVVPYKGPVLACVAYGSAIRRDYSDLDFIVPQKYILETAALLKSAGYCEQFDRRELRAGEGGFAPGQYSFRLPSQDVLVEFHTERTLRYFPVPMDLPDVTSRLMTVEVGGRLIRTFSLEDTLVMLTVHGTKHFWERLVWVLDIAKLMLARQVDSLLLLELAAKMESTRVLLLGICLAHDLFGVPLPERIQEGIRRDRTVRVLAEKVCEQYGGISDPGGGVWQRATFRFRSREGFGQGLRHMLRLTMSPTESDRESVRLPRLLAPLYTLVRPLRLLREYGLGTKRR